MKWIVAFALVLAGCVTVPPAPAVRCECVYPSSPTIPLPAWPAWPQIPLATSTLPWVPVEGGIEMHVVTSTQSWSVVNGSSPWLVMTSTPPGWVQP